jgi:hypothetical protein
MQALVNKYAHVEGDYESTMLGGIVHAYCDSGILTDALSAEDAERISTYFTDEGKDSGTLELFNTYLQEVEGNRLECCTVIDEMCAIIEDVELASAYIGKLTDSLMEHCYTE